MTETRTISRIRGLPEFGEEINTKYTNKQRAVVGWNHNNDTEEGRRYGKIWCWVSEGDQEREKFQVYDQDFNRSPVPGEVRDCGVANFTMIEMFHPYWCPGDYIPKDKVWADKRMCRQRYKSLFRQMRINLGLPVDYDPNDPFQPPGRPRRGRRHRKRGKRAPTADTNDTTSGESSADDDADDDERMFVTDDEDDTPRDTSDDSNSSRQSSSDSVLATDTRGIAGPRANQITTHEITDPIVIDDDDDSKSIIMLTPDSGISMSSPNVKMEPPVIDLTNDRPVIIDLTDEGQDEVKSDTEQQNLDDSELQTAS